MCLDCIGNPILRSFQRTFAVSSLGGRTFQSAKRRVGKPALRYCANRPLIEDEDESPPEGR